MNLRASAFLEIKGLSDTASHWIVEGIASTPTPDHGGDIVEPLGAKFHLPFPLLWMHDQKKPIGEVFEAKASEDGITFRARIPKVTEAGTLRDRIDEAVQSVRHGLVKGTSIGFKPVADKWKWLKSGGQHFFEWIWHELSLVPMPMNSEATITSIKSAYGAASGRTVVRLQSVPGASGTSTETKGKDMKTIQERMSSWEAKRQATDAARAAIMEKAEKDGDRTLTIEEKQEYTELTSTLNEVDDHLGLLRDEEVRVKANAKPVTPDDGKDPDRGSAARGGGGTATGRIFMKDNMEPGVEFARYVKVQMLAKDNEQKALLLGKQMYPDSTRLHNVLQVEANHGTTIAKANVLAATTTDATWAGALVQYQDFAGAFLEWLRPQTIVGKFGANGIPALTRVPFNARVRAQTSGGLAYWTGEGKPKPLTKFDFTNITMATTKITGLAVVTLETLRLATPSADALVRNGLRGAILERMDRDFVDPDFAGLAAVSPASITYGAPTAAAGGTTNPFVISDMGTAVDNLLQYFPEASISGLVWLMAARTAYRLSQAQNSLGNSAFPNMSISGGNIGGIPVITSEFLSQGGGLSPASNNLVILVHAPSILLADDGEVTVDSSSEASLQMLDNPTNDTVTPTATTMVSMYQTNSVAIRAERFINWKVGRTGAVYVITGVAYSGLAA